MLDQPLQRRPEATRPFGDRALRWSWFLFLLSYPWHLVGGGIALWVTAGAGGDFGAGVAVPGYIYPALYVWMMAPLAAAIVIGALGWLRGHRPAAIVPALASAAMIVILTIFSYQEFWD